MDVVFEDNSPDEVAVQIVDLYKLFVVPSHAELLTAVNSMKFTTPIVSDVLHVNVPVTEVMHFFYISVCQIFISVKKIFIRVCQTFVPF